jgi:hypothetical protein
VVVLLESSNLGGAEVRAELASVLGDAGARERQLREAHRLYVEMGARGHAARLGKELGL